MDSSAKKVIKKTTSTQFEVLVKTLEDNPDLARGAPTFGADKTTVDELWQRIAVKVNSYGPPQRSAADWKKIWFDLKSRTKKKIAENNVSLHATGGGPFVCSTLTEIEKVVDRILLMSKAAAPSGKVLGMRSAQPAENSGNRRAQQIAQPTAQPTAQSTAQPTAQLIDQQINKTPTTQIQTVPILTPTRQTQTDILLTPTRQTTQIGIVTPRTETPIRRTTETENTTPNIARSNPKRKRTFQEKIADSARDQAKAAKIQAEASQQIAAALQIQAEATRTISANLAELVKITARQTEAFEDFVKVMKNT